jgi:uncharacterized protein YjiS (DUF1127 family)
MHATLNLAPPAALRRGPLADRLAAGLAGFAGLLARWRNAHRHQSLGARELRSMSDLELRDLGMGRSEIPYALEE